MLFTFINEWRRGEATHLLSWMATELTLLAMTAILGQILLSPKVSVTKNFKKFLLRLLDVLISGDIMHLWEEWRLTIAQLTNKFN